MRSVCSTTTYINKSDFDGLCLKTNGGRCVLICTEFSFDAIQRRKRRCSISKRYITRASASVATEDVTTI